MPQFQFSGEITNGHLVDWKCDSGGRDDGRSWVELRRRYRNAVDGVMPDIHRAIRKVYRSLAPGGTFIIFDFRTILSGPARIVNPIRWRFFYWFANWNPNGDTIDSLTDIFEQVEIVETHAAGAAYTNNVMKQ